MNINAAIALITTLYKVGVGILDLKKSEDLPEDKSELLGAVVGRVSTDIAKILEDNEVSMSDIGTIVKLITDASALIGMDFGKVIEELVCEVEDNKSDVIEAFKSEFQLPNDLKEAYVEAIFDEAFVLLSSSLRLYNSIKQIMAG